MQSTLAVQSFNWDQILRHQGICVCSCSKFPIAPLRFALVGSAPMSTPNASLAVCLVGFVRTLSQPYVHNSIAAAFRAQGRADFFGVVALGGADTAKGQWQPVSQASLSAAMVALKPVVWEVQKPDEHTRPPCGLHCMHQFVRFQRCTVLVDSYERQHGRVYDWVVKARPDVFMRWSTTPRAGGSHLWANAKVGHQLTMYKDMTAGDMVVFVARSRVFNLAHALAGACGTPGADDVLLPTSMCPSNRSRSVVHACKCNDILSHVAVSQRLRIRYHSMRPSIVRTPESSKLINQLVMARHDPMQALHNVMPNDARWLIEGHQRAGPAPEATNADESHHPRAGSDRGVALGSAESHPKLLDGYCGLTLREVNQSQDDMDDACAFGDRGSWSLGNLSTDVFSAGAMDKAMATAHGVCAALCAKCERCVVISFSVLHNDVRHAPRLFSMPSRSSSPSSS